MTNGNFGRIRIGSKIGTTLTVLGKIPSWGGDPVFLVWNHLDWCPMALKLFRSRRRARREATALSSLSHPNIVRCFGYRKPSYTLMEFLEGPTLRSLMARQPKKRLTISNAIRVAIYLGSALQHIHAKGFIHMDVKPDNVIVINARPVLFDFGSMRIKGAARPPNIDGTDPYIAPEESLLKDVDEKADVFSLGVTLYKMLTGKFPFPDRKYKGRLSQVTRPPTRLRRHLPTASKALEAIVMACLARAPAERPTISALLPDLHGLIRGGPAMWPAGFQPNNTTRPIRRMNARSGANSAAR